MQQVSTLRRLGRPALVASLLALAAPAVRAQGLLAPDTVGTFTLSGYADAYYAAFSGDYAPGQLVEFETMSSRANTFGLNVVGLAGSYSSDRLRGTAELIYGEVQETAWLGNFVKNANVGYRLGEGLWLDAGYFSTYVGVESALPKDNIFSSVAVSTYQEPYFHSGAKLSYAPSDALALELWAVNRYTGYDENNGAKTIGVVARYTFADDYTLSYTGTFGRETDGAVPDGMERPFRLYNNVNLVASPTDKLDLLINGSVFTETNSLGANSDEALTGVNGMATLRYHVSDLFAIAGRGSFLSGDAYGSYNDIGLSLQLTPGDNAYVRLEGRTIGSDVADAFGGADPSDRRFDFVVSAGVNLAREWNLLRRE